MTLNCKHCGNDINETHVTEEIDREGETVTRHYCSARCFARDKGYARSPTQPIVDTPDPQPIPDPPNPNPRLDSDDPLIGGPHWQELRPYDTGLTIDNSSGTNDDSTDDVRIPIPHRYD